MKDYVWYLPNTPETMQGKMDIKILKEYSKTQSQE